MKNTFWVGFSIGAVYIVIISLIVEYTRMNGGGDGLGMIFEIIAQPASFIVGGVLEYILRLINLRDVFFDNVFIYWSLFAITQGVFFGIVFVAFKKLFFRKNITPTF